MPENDPFRKYIDAGMVFTQLTRQRAEEIVRDLMHNGEVNREQATHWVEEVLERSRQSTELLLGLVRKELDERISQLNLVTRDDLANLASRITSGVGGLRGSGTSRTKTAPAKKAGGAKASGAAQASGATKSATTKSATTKAAAKKAPAKAAAPKKAATKKAAAEKTSTANSPSTGARKA